MFGQIKMNKNNGFFPKIKNGFGISPYLQELMLYAGQSLPCGQAAKLVNKFLVVAQAGVSQIQRLVNFHGETKGVKDALQQATVEEAESEGRVYCGADASVIFTDEEYKEVKLGRIFNEAQIEELSSGDNGEQRRQRIGKSDYLAHFGAHTDFIKRFDPLLEIYASKASELVFLADGGTWIWKWIEEKYPDSVFILDFYHAAENLGKFALTAFKDVGERKKWMDQNLAILMEGKTQEVIDTIKQRIKESPNATTEGDKLLTYYTNNLHRMQYDKYQEKNYYIGSGAIESAHGTVIQQRCRLVGQRWTNKVQKVLNLRSLEKSGKWDKMVNIILKETNWPIAA